MHRPPRHRHRRSRLLAGFALVAALFAAIPSLATEVTAVRVGSHPTYTRVVFELDAAAGYRIERIGTDAAPMLRITLDASSRAHQLRATGDIRSVTVEAGAKALAQIAFEPGLRLREMILSSPPRIVLDMFKPESQVAAAVAPKSGTAAKTTAPKREPAPKVAITPPAPAPKTAVAPPAPAPKVAAVPPAPVPKAAVAPPAPAPKTAVAPPAPSPAPGEPPKPVVPSEAKAAPPALTPAPRATEAPSAPGAMETAKAPLPTAREPLEPEPAPEIARVAPAPPAPPVAPIAPVPREIAKRAQPIRPAAPAKVAPMPAAPRSTAGPSWRDRLTGDRNWQGGIAAATLGLVAIAVVLLRRRRALPNDLDVTAIAEEIEGSGRIPSGGFAMDDTPAARSAPTEETSFAGLFDEPAAPAPVPRPVAAPPVPIPPRPAPRESAAGRAAPAAATETHSLFDDAGGIVGEDPSQGDAPMNQDMDLPVDPRISPPPAPPRMGGSAAPSPDMSRTLQELERRMQTLEAKLDQANEAREKLERQVAAQSEELRVQRAAIARTQRALRTMSRGEEDKATEPALRDGDTQAKTRVNV